MYTTFRAVDSAGFSNPSPVFVLTRHNYGDGTYTTFEPYEAPLSEPIITCNRLVSIHPSVRQTTFNVDSPQGLQSFESVPEELSSIILGVAEPEKPLLWNRKFKFRFTSVNSYNSFDVNCEFKYNKELIEPPSGTVSEGPRISGFSSNNFDLERTSRRFNNMMRSIRNINSRRDDDDTGPDSFEQDRATIVAPPPPQAVDVSGLNQTEEQEFMMNPSGESQGPGEPIIDSFAEYAGLGQTGGGGDSTYSNSNGSRGSGNNDSTGGGGESTYADAAAQHERTRNQHRQGS